MGYVYSRFLGLAFSTASHVKVTFVVLAPMNCFHGVIGLSHSPFVAAAYIVVCDCTKGPNRFGIFRYGDFIAAKRPMAADGNGSILLKN